MLTAITGINWGDEGKGRMVDLISQEYDIVARYQGGNNAGHTVKNERGKFVLNLLPSGILRPNVVCVMGNGMVIDPHHLDGEINKLREQGISITPANLKISDRATITMPYHVDQDGLEEARLSKTGAQFGSTKRGIAYTYGDKYMKKTLRMGDLLHLDDSVKKRLVTMVDSKNLVMEGSYNAAPISVDEMWAWLEKYAAIFKDYICDVGQYLADADAAGKKVLFEAQLGALRDIDFGIYPYTTSSNTIGAYAPIGAGIPGHKLTNSVGVMKAYSSCVGDGPFVTELAMTEEEKHALREAGHEYGAATGRPRRVGPIDLVASHIYLDVVSVGATINIMMAAALAEGQTILENAAKEPHIVDVANFLNSMGANIKGAGTDTIRIRGVNRLHGTEYSIIPDQIEAGTFMCAAAATRGDIMVKNVIPKHLEAISAKLTEIGCEVIEFDDAVRVVGKPAQRHTDIKTLPYPGFPTDMQPQMSVALVLANGTSMVTESIFENRFKYVDELARMGSNIKVEGNVAVIDGVKGLTGAQVNAPDLRAGAALVIAGLAADGYTVVDEIGYIQRGYECFEEKLQGLGAMIEKVDSDREVQKFKLRVG